MKLQSAKETQSPAAPPSDTDDMRKNDLAIRDCCLFFADQNRGYGALLVSMDKILCLECQKEGSFTACPGIVVPSPCRARHGHKHKR